MKNLIEKLYTVCKENNLIARKTDTSLVVHAWAFQLEELCNIIQRHGVKLNESSFGGHYKALSTMQDGYYISLEFM